MSAGRVRRNNQHGQVPAITRALPGLFVKDDFCGKWTALSEHRESFAGRKCGELSDPKLPDARTAKSR